MQKGPMTVSEDVLRVRVKDLYSTPVMKKLSLTTPFLFFCTYFAYYGIVLRLNRMYTADAFRAVLFTGIQLRSSSYVNMYITYLVFRRYGRFYLCVYDSRFFPGIVEFTATSVCLGLSGRTWINTNCILFFSSLAAGTLCLFINTLPRKRRSCRYINEMH